MEKIELNNTEKSWLFWASFAALMAAGVGFGIRVMIVGAWSPEFNITAQEAGSIFGAALWPIAVAMILFSLVVDKIGYKLSMIVAFSLQLLSVVMTIFTPSGEVDGAANFLWWASFWGGLGHGIIEAAINPLTATMYRQDKSKMLNILHAAWPAGIIVGALTYIIADSTSSWRYFFLMMLIPIIAYGIIFIKAKKFPIDERVEAGVGYKDMLKEFGGLGTFVAATFLLYELFIQIGVTTQNNLLTCTILGAIIGAITGFILKSKGKWLFFFLCLIMIPLATAEIATDGWIKKLMESVLDSLMVLLGQLFYPLV